MFLANAATTAHGGSKLILADQNYQLPILVFIFDNYIYNKIFKTYNMNENQI